MKAQAVVNFLLEASEDDLKDMALSVPYAWEPYYPKEPHYDDSSHEMVLRNGKVTVTNGVRTGDCIRFKNAQGHSFNVCLERMINPLQHRHDYVYIQMSHRYEPQSALWSVWAARPGRGQSRKIVEFEAQTIDDALDKGKRVADQFYRRLGEATEDELKDLALSVPAPYTQLGAVHPAPEIRGEVLLDGHYYVYFGPSEFEGEPVVGWMEGGWDNLEATEQFFEAEVGAPDAVIVRIEGPNMRTVRVQDPAEFESRPALPLVNQLLETHEDELKDFALSMPRSRIHPGSDYFVKLHPTGRADQAEYNPYVILPDGQPHQMDAFYGLSGDVYTGDEDRDEERYAYYESEINAGLKQGQVKGVLEGPAGSYTWSLVYAPYGDINHQQPVEPGQVYGGPFDETQWRHLLEK